MKTSRNRSVLVCAHSVGRSAGRSAARGRCCVRACRRVGPPLVHALGAGATPARHSARRRSPRCDRRSGLQGDPERGEALFRDLCARLPPCRRRAAGGPGPDLSRVGNWSPERVLHDVLEPNAEVDADYPNHVVETVEGEVFSGLLAESPERRRRSADCRRHRGQRPRRADSSGCAAPALSMMPEGLLAGLEPAAVADLLAFLLPSRQGRRR